MAHQRLLINVGDELSFQDKAGSPRRAYITDVVHNAGLTEVTVFYMYLGDRSETEHSMVFHLAEGL